MSKHIQNNATQSDSRTNTNHQLGFHTSDKYLSLTDIKCVKSHDFTDTQLSLFSWWLNGAYIEVCDLKTAGSHTYGLLSENDQHLFDRKL